MIDHILSWSLRHRGVVIGAWLVVALGGVASALRLPLDAFPDTTPVQVQVNLSAPSLSPLEIEQQLTVPFEQRLAGMPGLIELRSLSRQGYGQLTCVFSDDVDVDRARQRVSERVVQVSLPPGVDPPTLGPTTTGLGEIVHWLVSSPSLSVAELRTLQDRIIAPRLRQLPGVAEINSHGGDERQFHVVVDAEALGRYGLTVADVVDAVTRRQGTAGGGTLVVGGEANTVVARALFEKIEDIEDVVVAVRDSQGQLDGTAVPVLVKDVGRVVVDRELRRGAVTAGLPGSREVVLGLGFLLRGENSRAVSQALVAELAEIKKTLPKEVAVDVVYDRKALIDQVLATVGRNLVEGALLVILVLFFFLGDLRAGLIAACVIPLSMCFALECMLAFGVAGSLMSLGAIDFGLLVDSAVIQVENSMRRLKGAAPEIPTATVVAQATSEVRRPTLFGELVLAVVYLPILTLAGIEGKLFRPMALTVLFALLGSLLLSLTLVPVLQSLLLRRQRGEHRDPLLVRGALRVYRPILNAALASPRLIAAAAVVVVAVTGALVPLLGGSFVPRLSEGTIVINTVRLASVSLQESVRVGARIEQLLLTRFPDEIERVWTRTGTAEVTTDPMGPELSDVFVTLRPRDRWTAAATQDELEAQMKLLLAALPGMRAVLTQPIEMRTNEMVAGVRADVGVQLFGDDLEVLKRKALQVDGLLRSIEGATDVSTEQITGSSNVVVDVDGGAAARVGLAADEVLLAVQALAGVPAGSVREGEWRVPVRVRFEHVDDVAGVSGLLLVAPRGLVPLADVARVYKEETPTNIQRQGGKRRVIVQANVRGRDLSGFVAELDARLPAEVALPPGTFFRIGGQHEHLQQAMSRLAVVVPVALLLVFGLLFLTYGRVVDALRVFCGVPFAITGGVVALLARGLPFSVSAAIGFIALAGVSVLGDMVLVSTIRAELGSGEPGDDSDAVDVKGAVRRAALLRLRPVLMTGLVASLGFVPMALSTGIGAEVQRPLATVVVGGVLSSTLLTLVVLPVLFVLSRRGRWRA